MSKKEVNTAEKPYDTLVKNRSDYLRFAAHLCGKHHTAEDIVQQAYLKVLSAGNLSDKNPHNYMLTTIHRIFIDELRKKKPCLESEQSTGESIDLALLKISDPKTELDPNIASAVNREVDSLPQIYREAIRYRYFCGLDYKEIEEISGIPESTARWRMCIARKSLKENLNPESLQLVED